MPFLSKINQLRISAFKPLLQSRFWRFFQNTPLLNELRHVHGLLEKWNIPYFIIDDLSLDIVYGEMTQKHKRLYFLIETQYQAKIKEIFENRYVMNRETENYFSFLLPNDKTLRISFYSYQENNASFFYIEQDVTVPKKFLNSAEEKTFFGLTTKVLNPLGLSVFCCLSQNKNHYQKLFPSFVSKTKITHTEEAKPTVITELINN